MKLSAVRLFVNDLTGAREFYERTLGLPLTADGTASGYCSFKSAGVHIIVETVSPQDNTLVGRFTGVSFAVDDIYGEYRRLKSAGVEFTGAPEVQFWGGTLATFQDPDGNELQLVQSKV